MKAYRIEEDKYKTRSLFGKPIGTVYRVVRIEDNGNMSYWYTKEEAVKHCDELNQNSLPLQAILDEQAANS